MAVWKTELSLALARNSLDRITSGIAILNPDGSVLYANPRFLQLLGSVARSIDPSDIRIESAPFNRSVSDDQPADEEFEVYGAGVAHVCLRGSSVPIPDDDGEAVATLVTIDDVASRFSRPHHSTIISERMARLRTFSSSLARAATLASVADAIVNEGRIAADGHSSVLAVTNEGSSALRFFATPTQREWPRAPRGRRLRCRRWEISSLGSAWSCEASKKRPHFIRLSFLTSF